MATTAAARVARGTYHGLCFILAVLIPIAFLGFGRSYFDGQTFAGQPLTGLIHAHAALMMLWIIMLIAQAWFIRTRRFALHRWVGRSSYIVAPIVVLSALAAVQDGIIRNPAGITAVNARIKVFGLGMSVAFALTYGLAIFWRRRTAVHVRFMISTAFAFGSAIIFRIVGHWFAWIPGLDRQHPENLAMVNGTVLILMLLCLIANDWRLGIRRSPFWVVTIVTLLIHIGYFTVTKSEWWPVFIEWFAGLRSFV